MNAIFFIIVGFVCVYEELPYSCTVGDTVGSRYL